MTALEIFPEIVYCFDQLRSINCHVLHTIDMRYCFQMVENVALLRADIFMTIHALHHRSVPMG